jgi:hypothetical protein
MHGRGNGGHGSPIDTASGRPGGRRRRLRLALGTAILAALSLAVFAAAAGASGFAQGPPAGPKAPPFTQCPAIGLDSTCQYLIDVTSTAPKAVPTILKDSSQTFYDGGDDVTVAVQNDTTGPLGSIHVGIAESGDFVFGLDGDGLCSESIFPKPEECPFGPNLESPFDYYGPDTGFTIESVDAGTVFFNTALQPGQYTYFTLEAPPNGTSIAAGEVNDTISTTLTPENPEVFPEAVVTLPAPGNVTDTATIKGPKAAAATGTVEYNVYSDPECTKLVTKAGPKVAVASGIATASEPVGAKAPFENNKSYYWQVKYSGDGVNEPAVSVCGDEVMTFGKPIPPPEPSIVTVLSGGGQLGAKITVPEGTAVTDTAIITAPGGQPVSGRLTYAAYSNPLCFGKPIGVGGGGSTAGAGPSTNSVTLGIGTYYFQAFYSGNGVLNRASTACGSEVLTVVAKIAPPPPPPPNNQFTSIGKPRVNEKNGQIVVVDAFPAAGTATVSGVVQHGATLARVEAFLVEAAKSKKCKRGFIKKHGKCVSDKPVVFGVTVFTVPKAGTYAIVLKPTSKVLKALKSGKKLLVTVTTTFHNAAGGTPVSHVQTVLDKIKKQKKHKKH